MHSIQKRLDLVDIVFCSVSTIDNVVYVLGKCLTLPLELLKFYSGDELESLTERGGACAAKRLRMRF